jgi:hypothetical protein
LFLLSFAFVFFFLHLLPCSPRNGILIERFCFFSLILPFLSSVSLIFIFFASFLHSYFLPCDSSHWSKKYARRPNFIQFALDVPNVALSIMFGDLERGAEFSTTRALYGQWLRIFCSTLAYELQVFGVFRFQTLDTYVASEKLLQHKFNRAALFPGRSLTLHCCNASSWRITHHPDWFI